MSTTAETVLADPGYAGLKRFIIEHTGLAYYEDRDRALAGHVARGMTAAGATSCSSYADLLRGERDGAHLESLVEACTIGETYFFRHMEQLDALREVALPAILGTKPDGRALRIWSAGCANGAEVYTLAILLREGFTAALENRDVYIIGTDINRSSLDEARRGVYRDWALRTTPEDVRHRHFRPDGDGWRIADSLRESVTFRAHNLMSDSFGDVISLAGGRFDLIVCRNVMIYFDDVSARGLVTRLRDALADGGWLATGHADLGEGLYEGFGTVSAPGAVLHRKHSGPVVARPPPRTAPRSPRPRWTGRRTPRPSTPT